MDQVEQHVRGQAAQFFLGMYDGGELRAVYIQVFGIVVAGDGDVFGYAFPGFPDGADHVAGELVVIADYRIYLSAAADDLLQTGVGMDLAVLCIEPDDPCRIIGFPCFWKCTGIYVVAFLSLAVIAFKDPVDLPMSEADQVLRQEEASLFIIQKYVGPVSHGFVFSLNKYVRDLVFLQLLEEIDVLTVQIALTGFDDDPVDVLVQKLCETGQFSVAGVVGMLQDEVIAVGRQDLINPTDHLREDIVGQIGHDHGDIPGLLPVQHPFGYKASASVLRVNVSFPFQPFQRLPHGLTADTVTLGQYIFGRELIARFTKIGEHQLPKLCLYFTVFSFSPAISHWFLQLV